MIITRRHLSRRTILRGIGASLALPFLDAMVPALGAQSVTGLAPVRRWVTFYAPNGMAMQYWAPPAEGALIDLPRTLAPLAPYRERLLVTSGLADMTAYSRPLEGGGDHARASGTFLTGVHVKKTAGAPESGISADQVAARAIGRDTQIPSLELGVDSGQVAGLCDSGYNCSYISTVSWSGATNPQLPENNPRALFERLFGDTAQTPEQRAERLRREISILDVVTAKLADLNRRVGSTDRAKLDEYLESIRDVERRIQRVEQSSVMLPAIDAPAAVPPGYEDHARMLLDLLVLAFQADLTRVATFMIARESSGRAYPEIGVPDSHHPLSHHDHDPAKLDRLAAINQFHVRQFAHFAERLATTSDGSGTLLDRSVLLYGAGISDSNDHTHVDLPVALVTGERTGFASGRHVRFPDRTPVANLHTSILNSLGVTIERMGDSTGALMGLRND
jgi:hypothetical protein